MTTRLGWILEGLRTGIVTTSYPAHPDPIATAGIRVWPHVHPERCRADAGCEACISACLPGALSLLEDNTRAQASGGDAARRQGQVLEHQASTTLVLDLGKCIGCGLCAQVCPHDAVEIAADVELATRDSTALRQFLPLAGMGAPDEAR